MEQMTKVGRPTVRTEENAEAILSRLAQGESLVGICNDPAFPSYSSVLSWLHEDENFRGGYARAREDQGEALAQQTIEIARNATPENVQVAKLQVDTLKWHASKLKPKVYGEKASEVNVSNTVNNIQILTTDKLREIQDRREQLLAGRTQ